MFKNAVKFLFIFAIILFISAQLPVSLAAQYGAVQGHALDRNGNGIPGVKITLQDGQYQTVGSTVTDAHGAFVFGQVAMAQSEDVYKVKASLTVNGQTWQSETAFFNVMALQTATQDVNFPDYPESGVGGLYGVVSTDNNVIFPEPATIYLSNGMFALYGGDRFDQWSFDQLPAGKYALWAERNVGDLTYSSARYTVTVTSDQNGYVFIYLPVSSLTATPVAYHVQPSDLKNVVHGAVIQKNGAPYPGARVDLYCVSGGGSETFVATATTNQTGQFLFDDVNVEKISAHYMVHVTYDAQGSTQTLDSDQFTVYYADTLNVSHDYYVPVNLPVSVSGNVLIKSVPAGARISIDGSDTGQVTPYNASIKAGTHSLDLSFNGYFDDIYSLQVQPDAAVTIVRTLKSNTGNLSLEVSPASARVYLDGQCLGTSPVELTKKMAGEHSYVLVCDGYRNETGTITIVPGETVTKQITMVATPGLSLDYIAYLFNSMIGAIGSIF